MNNSLHDIAEQFTGGAELLERRLRLALPDHCLIDVRSNDNALLDTLARYFEHLVVEADGADADINVHAIDRPVLATRLPFREWPREPGKQSRKDAYLDLPSGRALLKVRTGMLFIQSETLRLAAGPCRENDNQLINFVLNQYMNWLQQRHWLICHAAALSGQGGATGIAGLSGGGKSTLMLHLLEQPDRQFVSNDRLFIRRDHDVTEVRGIPKLPRINPGTILHNPRLQPLLDGSRRQALLALPPDALWQLEEKYDVPIASLYGSGRMQHEARLARFVVLNWQRDSELPTALRAVEPGTRPDLMPALMKSPGPFFQDAEGRFLRGSTVPPLERYLEALGDTPLYELSGRIDFEAAVTAINALDRD